MKKIVSLICCVAVMLSLCATSALASTPHVTMSVDKTSVKVGDTFTVTLDQGELSATSFAGRVVFDKEYLTVTAITDLRDKTNGYVMYDDDGDEMRTSLSAFATVEAANTTGEAGYSLTNTQEKTYLLTSPIIKVTFTAIKAGTANVSVFETSDGATAYTGTHSTTAITIEGNEPAAPVVGTPSNDGDNAKVWAVTVAGDYVATKNGALDATLTQNDLSETQEFKLNVNGIGDAEWTFNVRVTFTDPQYRANTVLTVE